MTDVVSIIAQLGFPVAAAIAVGWYVVQLNKQHREDMTELNKSHRDEIAEITKDNANKMEKLTEAINNNTLVMTRIYERLGVENGEKDN